VTRAIPSVEARSDEAPAFRVVDYCRLAEECFVLAAAARDSEVAAELVKAGDDYMRLAGESVIRRARAGLRCTRTN
jgi:hypothetical protein